MSTIDESGRSLFRLCRDWQGWTSGDLLSAAEVAPTGTGAWAVWTSRLPGHVLTLADDGSLVVSAGGLDCCRMLLTSTELSRMEGLTAECEARYSAQEDATESAVCETLRVYLVNEEGVRQPLLIMSARTTPQARRDVLADLVSMAARYCERFVILGAAGVQVYANDKRDITGAYVPPPMLECSRKGCL